jgi:hypothetical protein
VNNDGEDLTAVKANLRQQLARIPWGIRQTRGKRILS